LDIFLDNFLGVGRGATEKRPKIAKNDQKNNTLSLFQGGGL